MKRYLCMALIASCVIIHMHAYRQPYIPLLGTARLGSEKLSYERLRCGENPNQHDEFGNTPLHYTVFIESKEVTNLLLAHHANPNAQNKKGKTPLHIAVQKGNDYLARRLMKYGANPNMQDENGDTPLHIVTRNTERKHSYRLVRDLLCYGANKQLANRAHETPGQLAQPLCIRPVIVHARYKQEKVRSKILTLLKSQECFRPYISKVKRPRKMYV